MHKVKRRQLIHNDINVRTKFMWLIFLFGGCNYDSLRVLRSKWVTSSRFLPETLGAICWTYYPTISVDCFFDLFWTEKLRQITQVLNGFVNFYYPMVYCVKVNYHLPHNAWRSLTSASYEAHASFRIFKCPLMALGLSLLAYLSSFLGRMSGFVQLFEF